MSTNQPEQIDPEDMFHETRMSFGDHIEDLRTHLLRALKGFLIGMVICIWPLGPYVMKMIVAPLEDQLKAFEKKKLKRDESKYLERMQGKTPPSIPVKILVDRDKLRAELGLPPLKRAEPMLEGMVKGFEGLLVDLEAIHLLNAENRKEGNFALIDGHFADPLTFNRDMARGRLEIVTPRVSTMEITEAFFIYFKIALITGLVVSSPWVFYHIWAFVAAGLYPNEKKLVHVYMPFSLFLFLGGALICQFAVMPRAIEAMLWFNEWLDLDATLRLEEWLTFALLMPVVFGVSFQTPLVMMFAHKIGIVTVDMYREKRRIAWFGMAIFAAVITPSMDPGSMMFLWVPMGCLYELGILLCVYQGKEEEGLAEWELEDQRKGEPVEV